MTPPRSAAEYRQAILKFGSRSYTRSILHGYIYRFLVELLRDNDADLARKFPNLDHYEIAHVTKYDATTPSPPCQISRYSYSQLQQIAETTLPNNQQGHVLFLCGHLSGSWVSTIGAKYGIVPEFFRKHIHLWRSAEGPVLYAIPRLPSATCRSLSLRINTQGYSMLPLNGLSLVGRAKLLPDEFEANPSRLAAAPGSSYVRGHAYLSNSQFLIEQEISITIQAEESGGWTAVLWSDVGNRPLSQSLDFHRFIAHLTACSKTGFSSIRFIPPSLVGRDSDVCDDALPFLPSLHPTSNDPSLIQSATHLPHEHHLLVDPTIAALDPMYALTPIFAFAAATENEILGTVSKRYELISSTRWDPKHSVDYMEQLILHKHLLDEHAFRHEEVLRFLAQEDFVRFESNLSPEHAVIARKAKQSLKEDFEFLLHRCNILSTRHDGAMNNLVGLTALGEARKQIRLATQVTKLTVLATVFLPLSFCTSIFGMNFVELVGLRVWVWGLVTVLVGGVTVVGYAWDERGVWVEGVRRLWARRGGGSEGA